MGLIGRYWVLGTAVFPPILYGWYKILDGRLIGTATKTVVTKVILDQAVSAPVILFLFYTGKKIQSNSSGFYLNCFAFYGRNFSFCDFSHLIKFIYLNVY